MVVPLARLHSSRCLANRTPAAMAIQLHFTLALSGNTLGVVRVNLPWRPDLELLSQQLGQSVHTYLVDCSGEPLRHFVEGAGTTCQMCHLSLVQRLGHDASVLVLPLLLCTQFWLRNLCQRVHITLKPGWRRHYREFTRAAAEMPMQALSCRHYVAHGWLHTYGRSDVRPLAAILLQAVAASYRRVPRYGRRRTRSRRSWAGAQHALVRRSGLPAAEVNIFAAEWLQMHGAWVDAVVAAVTTEVVYIE